MDWYSLFPNAVLAESALDRLVNSAHHVFFKGDDRNTAETRHSDRGRVAEGVHEVAAI